MAKELRFKYRKNDRCIVKGGYHISDEGDYYHTGISYMVDGSCQRATSTGFDTIDKALCFLYSRVEGQLDDYKGGASWRMRHIIEKTAIGDMQKRIKELEVEKAKIEAKIPAAMASEYRKIFGKFDDLNEIKLTELAKMAHENQ